MQNSFMGVKKKKSNKSLVQKQPGALTADAVNEPAITGDSYSSQVVNNGETFIKVLPITGYTLPQCRASPFPSEGEIGQKQDNIVSRVLSDMPYHPMCRRGT